MQLIEKQQKEKEYLLIKAELEKEVHDLKSKPFGSTPAKSTLIYAVHKVHLALLRGNRMIYKLEPNGACAHNGMAVHAYEDEKEGRISNHIADNWLNYYNQNFGLPYIETVGVGKDAKTIKEEMVVFVRSEEALKVLRIAMTC